ncbi:MAG TPA: glycosyltransferase family 2 protein [Gemmatimonadales bacterium]|nr:glycosyltransferase family 2 protein [Gemmatimonadales bacterium]
MPQLSVVVPVYNEEATVDELRRRLGEVLDRVEPDYEVLLVNDGSRDGTAEALRRIAQAGSRWRAIHFSRNFGHQAAVAAGLRYATGQAVVVMDADLQDPPELLEQMLARWREGFEVVYAQRVSREREGPLKRGLAWLYYRVLRAVSPVDIPTDTGDFCLMDRKVVDQLIALPERNRYIRGLRAWVGFRQTSVQFERAPRFAGEPKYTFRKSLGLGVNGIISFSKAPLRIATWLGLLVSLMSFVLVIVFVIEKLTRGFEIRGWASTVVIILFLGGVQLLTIGIIGEYLSRIYDEVKQRPLYVVRDTDNTAGASR